MWSQAAPSAKAELLDVHARLRSAQKFVPQVYEGSDRDAANQALGIDLLAGLVPGSPEVGPALLDRLLKPEGMRFDQQARDGLLTAKPEITGDRAVLVTGADETFTFERVEEESQDGSTWRCRLVMDVLEKNEPLKQLLANAATMEEKHRRSREAWSAVTDPKTPQGAYNRLRMAVSAKPPDIDTIHRLLDEPTRDALIDALKVSRKAQRIVQRRTKLAERKQAYKQRGLQSYVMTRTDLQLYKEWAKSKEWTPPVDPKSLPLSAAPGIGQREGLTELTLEGGGKALMRLETDGHWRIADHQETIRKALEGPMKELVASLTGSK